MVDERQARDNIDIYRITVRRGTSATESSPIKFGKGNMNFLQRYLDKIKINV